MSETQMISWIIPAYNEENRIQKTMTSLVNEFQGLKYEILVIDDGSTDNTSNIVDVLCKNCIHYTLVKAEHRGRGGALKLGIQRAVGDMVVLSSADIVIQRENLLKSLELLKRSSDIVMLSKYLTGSQVIARKTARNKLGLIFMFLVRWLFHVQFRDTQGVKLCRSDVIKSLSDHSSFDDYLFDTEVAIQAHRQGFVVSEVPWSFVEVEGSKVRLIDVPKMFVGLLKLRFKVI